LTDPLSYLVCATPRTGSSLLCGLLRSTGMAGRPESYFRQPDEESWADRWGLDRTVDGSFRYHDYVGAAIADGTTANAVFGARVMWGTLDEMVAKVAPTYADRPGSDLELLQRVFGPTRFVFLDRHDVLGQAVSWCRAEQTNVWFERTDRPSPPAPMPPAPTEPSFDLDRIHELVLMINDHNAAWQRWFESQGIAPHPVCYEDLDADPVAVTRAVLAFLGLELPPGVRIQARHRRLADERNTEWIERYRAEMPGAC
jgi:LPS sulfotransferase NodH